MYPANSTVPPAAAYILVPELAAMSNPLWFVLPTPPGEERRPNLDVIVPETGFTVNFTPFTLDAFETFTTFEDAATVFAFAWACFLA